MSVISFTTCGTEAQFDTGYPDALFGRAGHMQRREELRANFTVQTSLSSTDLKSKIDSLLRDFPLLTLRGDWVYQLRESFEFTLVESGEHNPCWFIGCVDVVECQKFSNKLQIDLDANLVIKNTSARVCK